MRVKIIVIILVMLAVGGVAKHYYVDVPAAEAALENELAKENAKQDILKKFMNQGNGKIRKPGQSGFKQFGSNSF
jgi:hypothetical protein